MGDAGDAKQIPVGAFNRCLVAHQQGAYQPSPSRLGDCLADALPCTLAQLFDGKLPGVFQALCGLVFGAVTHMAAGVQALLPHPQFRIKTAGVGQTMRSLQTHGELPTLARLNIGQSLALAAANLVVPSQLNIAGQ